MATKIPEKKASDTVKVPELLSVSGLDESPILYADSLVHLAIGPFVSKATFGSQSVNGKIHKAQLTLVLPTNALLGLSQNIMKALAPEQAGGKLAAHYDALNGELIKTESKK